MHTVLPGATVRAHGQSLQEWKISKSKRSNLVFGESDEGMIACSSRVAVQMSTLKLLASQTSKKSDSDVRKRKNLFKSFSLSERVQEVPLRFHCWRAAPCQMPDGCCRCKRGPRTTAPHAMSLPLQLLVRTKKIKTSLRKKRGMLRLEWEVGRECNHRTHQHDQQAKCDSDWLHEFHLEIPKRFQRLQKASRESELEV